MLRSVLALIFVIVSLIPSIAQDKKEAEQAQSNFDKFTSRSGILFQRQYTDIGKVRGMDIKVLVVTDLLNTKAKSSCVRFEMETGLRVTRSEITTLDIDEVDGLIASLRYLKSTVFNTTPDRYTEITFRSRGGFEAGAFYARGSWTPYIYVSRYNKDSMFASSMQEFDLLLDHLLKAKPKL